MKNTQAVLFDMDGVILDSEPLHTVARARLFSKLGIPLDAEKQIVLGARKYDYWQEFSVKFALSDTCLLYTSKKPLMEAGFDVS